MLVEKRSTIPGAGIGLFTTEDIPPFSLLFDSFHKVIDGEKDFMKAFKEDSLNKALNHSDEPNVHSIWIGKNLFKFSLREIKAGEELFSDYRSTMNLIKSQGYDLNKDFLKFMNHEKL